MGQGDLHKGVFGLLGFSQGFIPFLAFTGNPGSQGNPGRTYHKGCQGQVPGFTARLLSILLIKGLRIKVQEKGQEIKVNGIPCPEIRSSQSSYHLSIKIDQSMYNMLKYKLKMGYP